LLLGLLEVSCDLGSLEIIQKRRVGYAVVGTERPQRLASGSAANQFGIGNELTQLASTFHLRILAPPRKHTMNTPARNAPKPMRCAGWAENGADESLEHMNAGLRCHLEAQRKSLSNKPETAFFQISIAADLQDF